MQPSDQGPIPTQLRSGTITNKVRRGPWTFLRILWSCGRDEWVPVSFQEYSRASLGAEVESGI